MNDPGLFDDKPSRMAIFLKHHEENPDMWKAFERFTFQAVAAGRKRLGANMVIERIRWYTQVEERSSVFKVNNNWAPFYSRLWNQKHPAHDELFVLRSMQL